MIETEVEQQAVVIQGPGQILKQARERANLSSQDIADRMKLKKVIIEEIEQDNYDINISLTFIKGYLKLYAKHVHVSEADIITAFESISTKNKEPAKLQSFSRRVAHQANDDKLMLVTYLILAAVIALVVIWWFQQSSPDTVTASNVGDYSENATQDLTTQTVSTPTDKNEAIDADAVTPPELRLAPVADEQVVDNQPNDVAIGNDASRSPQLTDIVATPEPETAEPVELVFEFSGDCWMNIADATGENIAYGVKVKGRVMPVTGIPPFVVTLGAPEVVKIRYAGEPLDMSFLPTGRIAKFDLPLSE